MLTATLLKARHLLWVFLLISVSGLLNPQALAETKKELLQRLQTAGHILMIRHANAPGNGDPDNFQVNDCSTQRNLDDQGRKQSAEIGNWLRSKGIKSAKVYSSQWCRCLETAKLLDMGPVEELPALNSFYELTQNREPNLKVLNKFISEQPKDGKLIILLTHFATISAITNEAVSSGDGVLLQLTEGGNYKVIGQIENMQNSQTFN